MGGTEFCLKAAAKKGDYGLWVRGAEGGEWRVWGVDWGDG